MGDSPNPTLEAAEASIDLNQGAEQTPEGSPPNPDAESSTAGTEGTKTDLLEAASKALDEVAKQDPSVDTAKAEESEAEAQPDSEENERIVAGDPLTGEEYENLDDLEGTDLSWLKDKKRTQRRVKQLLKERAEYRKGSEQFDQIKNFMDQNELGPSETADGMRLAAMIKGVSRGKLPVEDVLKEIDSVRDRVAQATGAKLPDDLQKRIDAGYIDEQSAQELSRARANEQIIRNAMREDQQRRAQNEQANASTAILTSLRTWEANTKANDPDFDRLAEFVASEATVLREREGIPATSEAAVALAQKAYSNVKQRFAQIFPNREVKPSPNSQHRSGATAPAPSGSVGALAAAEAALREMGSQI